MDGLSEHCSSLGSGLDVGEEGEEEGEEEGGGGGGGAAATYD